MAARKKTSAKAKASAVEPVRAVEAYSPRINPPARVLEKRLHKFAVGEKVTWQSQPIAQARSRGTVTVVLQLPPLGSNLQYRIKNLKDPHEFVVLEHELSRDPSPGGLSDPFS